MAHTQMTDRNLSDLGFMEELTNEELLAINGGGFWDDIEDKGKDIISLRMPIRHVKIWPVKVIWSILPIFPRP